MTSWCALVAALLALVLCPTSAEAQRACVEGETVYHAGYDPNLIDAIAPRASCVHLRLRQDDYTGFDDPRRLGTPPRTMTQIWDDLITEYRARGADVILVIGADAMGVSMDALRDPATRARYAALVVRVIARYVRQVKDFELADQPNLPPRAGVTGPWALPPADFAALALTTRQALERDLPGSLCNGGLRIALGGIVNRGDSDFGRYLRAVYAAGLGEDGATGLWTDYRERNRRLPFDAIAARSFPPWNPILAGGQGLDAATVVTDGVGDVLERFEGSATARPLWITAAGLPSNGTIAESARQMAWLGEFFDAVQRTDLRTRVDTASWYAFIDPPWDRGDWGFFDDGVFLASHAHDVIHWFTSYAERLRRPPSALLTWADAPLRLTPGQVARVHLRITNDGPRTDAGGWHPTDRVRVGAAPSCPDAEDVNQVRWTGFPTGGETGMGAAEARVNVPIGGARDWFAGESRTVEWDITAPMDPGRYALSARLIWGADHWFGQNVTTTVEVVSRDGGAGDAATDAVVATDVLDVIDVVDASDVIDAGDATDVVTASDVVDVVTASDVVDVVTAGDVVTATDVLTAGDVVTATDAVTATDVAAVTDVLDASEGRDVVRDATSRDATTGGSPSTGCGCAVDVGHARGASPWRVVVLGMGCVLLRRRGRAARAATASRARRRTSAGRR